MNGVSAVFPGDRKVSGYRTGGSEDAEEAPR
jgi:hypothetical protein